MLDLWVVVGILTLLVCLRLPALAKARHQTTLAQCASNLRQVTMALQIYGQENGGWLPSAAGGYWAWDLPWDLGTNFATYGVQKNAFYCPANSSQNPELLWNFAPGSYHVLGYATALNLTASVAATNLNPSLVPQSQPIPIYPGLGAPPLASQRVLVADATISAPGQANEALRYTYNYTSIQGGFSTAHRASHLEGLFPVGGNLGMLDGHVEWRKFADMHVRTDNPAAPSFWW